MLLVTQVTRLALAAAVGFLAVGLSASPALADRSACVGDKAALANVDRSIAEIDSSQLPGRIAADLSAVLDQLTEALTKTKDDLGTITDPVATVTGKFEEAKEKLDDIATKMDEMKVPRPRFLTTLKGKIDKLAESIGKGIERYKASAPGQTAAGLEKSAEFIGKVIEKIGSVKTALAGVNAIDDAKNGTGAEQIRAMKFGFDQLKSTLAVDEVPGLGDFLDAYSQAMDGIANSVDAIERVTKERLRMADIALRDSDVNVDNLYPGLKSPREKMALRLAALRDQRTALQAKVAANGCDEPVVPEDPCLTAAGFPQKNNRLIDNMTRGLRDQYRGAQGRYESAFIRLSTHALTQPQAAQKSREELALARHESALIRLERAARANNRSSYGTADPLAGAVEAARALGVTLPAASREWNTTAKAYLPLLKPALAQKKKVAADAARAAFAANETAWTDQHKALLDAVKAARAERDAAKTALDRGVGDKIVMESTARQWTKAQLDEFDACFPDKGRLRREAAARTPPPPVTKAADEKKADDKAKKPCKKGGGLAGAMDNVACQIGN
jgi:hypothetical protein